MGVVANGFPRSGTHLLTECIRLMGFEVVRGVARSRAGKQRKADDYLSAHGPKSVILGHAQENFVIGDHCVVQVIRDPRDCLISWARYVAKDGAYPPNERRVLRATPIALGRLANFIGWLDKADLVVRFADLSRYDVATIATIAYALDVGTDAEEISDGLCAYNGWHSGRLTDWRECWTPAIDEAFQYAGGDQMVAKLGFA